MRAAPQRSCNNPRRACRLRLLRRRGAAGLGTAKAGRCNRRTGKAALPNCVTCACSCPLQKLGMLSYVMGYRAGYKAATSADGPGGKGYDAAYRTGMQVRLASVLACSCPRTVVSQLRKALEARSASAR